MSLIGAIALTLSAYMLGVKISQMQKEPLTAVNAMAELLEYISLRLRLNPLPLHRLFENFQNQYLHSVGFLPLLVRSKSNIRSGWCQAVELLPLTPAIKQELFLYGQELGTLPLGEQQKRTELCLQRLKTECDVIKQALPKKQKSVRAVAFLAGAIISILLF